MDTHPAEDLVRKCFRAYETKDRTAIEPLLAEDFTFTSPLDNRIDRATYFQRCWPNSEHLRRFQIDCCIATGNDVFVTYTADRADGGCFRNTEFFQTDGERIRHVDVYFGTDDPGACEEEAVRAVIDQTVRAIRGQEVAALMACYSPDVMAFDLLPPLRYTGSATLQDRAAAWLTSFTAPPDYELRDLRVVVSGGCGFAHSLNHVRGPQQPDGPPVDMWWRATLGLEKRGENWLITHAHSSVPFAMDSLKAEVGLQP